MYAEVAERARLRAGERKKQGVKIGDCGAVEKVPLSPIIQESPMKNIFSIVLRAILIMSLITANGIGLASVVSFMRSDAPAYDFFRTKVLDVEKDLLESGRGESGASSPSLVVASHIVLIGFILIVGLLDYYVLRAWFRRDKARKDIGVESVRNSNKGHKFSMGILLALAGAILGICSFRGILWLLRSM